MTELYIFIILAILSGTATKLLNKYVVKSTEPYAFALITQLISSIIFFGLAFPKFILPNTLTAWLILALASILWSLIAVSVLISYKSAQVSIRDPLSQSKIIIALLFGTIFLGETTTINRIVGTIVIFLGICTLLFHPEKRFGRLSEPGVKWTFFSALLGATVAIVDKAALTYFNLETYAFLVYFLPLIILSLFLPEKIDQVKHLLRSKWKSSISAIVLSTVTYYLTLKSFSLADVTLVYPLLQLTTLLTVIGGIIFMKERDHLWQKIIAVVLVIAGSIILKL